MGGMALCELAANLARVSGLIAPSGNPDGRARCPARQLGGEVLATSERVGRGPGPTAPPTPGRTSSASTRCGGAAVGAVGAYFNHDGVNLMHDEWSEPMAAEARAFFRLARKRRPTGSCRCTPMRPRPRSSRRRTYPAR